MSVRSLFKISQNDRNKFCTHLIDSSAPKTDYYFLVFLSSTIVALGLLSDNIVLVIGGMLVTPLLSPILAISLGVLINDYKVIMRSVKIFLMSFLIAFLVALILGIFTTVELSSIGLIGKMEPNLFALFIAIIAGVAASYTWVKPTLNETLPGVAITVTLIPPLTAVGLAVAEADWATTINVVKVLLLNVFGIITASLVVFALMDFYKAKNKVVEDIKEEELELKKEKIKELK